MTPRAAPPGARRTGVLLVLALHAAFAWVLMRPGAATTPRQALALNVQLIAPAPVAPPAQPAAPPPRAVRLVARAPTEPQRPDEPLLPDTPPPTAAEPVFAAAGAAAGNDAPSEAPPAISAVPSAGLQEPPPELAVTCPERTPPEYPQLSRRLGETGTVLLEVELDERGQVAAARVVRSSGHNRLDEAGLAAVRRWHCQAPTRGGMPVRGVAVQPFRFVLQGR